MARASQSETDRTLEIITGLKATFVRLRVVAYLLQKRFLERTRFPLLRFRYVHDGLLKTVSLRRHLKLRKIIRFKKQYYFTLEKPCWPSAAFDNMVAGGGLNVAAAGTAQKKNIELAILAITRKCTYSCKHCYEHFNLAAEDTVPVETWIKTIIELQQIGTGIIVLSGGEPSERFDDVIHILQRFSASKSEFHLYTSGHGITGERAKALKQAGLHAVGVGLDDINPERFDTLRGVKGALATALSALECLQQAGLFTYLNVCLSSALVRSGGLWQLLETAHSVKAGALRLLEPKPCGGYLKNPLNEIFSSEDRKITTEFYLRVNNDNIYRHYPAVFYADFLESPQNMGCRMGGLSHMHVDSKGNVTPCVFIPVSFGSIMTEDFTSLFKRMQKAIPFPQRNGCASYTLARKFADYQARENTLPVPYEFVKEAWQKMFI